jgi:uncharacterized protein (DUF1778 family)
MQEEHTKKTARLEVRMPPATHALLQMAVDLQGRSMSDFVVTAAREAAEAAIAQHNEIQLTIEEQKRFADALLNPPPVAPALKRAAELHRKLVEPS